MNFINFRLYGLISLLYLFSQKFAIMVFMRKKKQRKNENVLKIIIAIGVVAIIFSLCLKYYHIFLPDLKRQQNDEKRIADIELLDSKLNDLQKTDSDVFKSEVNKAYISLPSDFANCSDLNLPSLSEGWEYRCKNKTDLRKTDGTGWIPIDFSKQLSISFNLLPVDPENSADDLNYYIFIITAGTDSKISWALSTSLESEKYIKEKSSTDDGIDDFRFEIGNNLKLLADSQGLLGFWNFNKNENDFVKDASGNGNDGKIVNDPEWVFGKNGQGYLFNGEDDFIDIPNSEKINPEKQIAIETWVKPIDATQRIMGKYNADSSGGWYLWFSPEKEFVFSTTDGLGYISLKSGKSYDALKWSHIVGQYDDATKKMTLFVNGEKVNELILMRGLIQSESNFTIGKFTEGADGFFKGTIDEVRIYNRILNEKEIQKSYLSAL